MTHPCLQYMASDMDACLERRPGIAAAPKRGRFGCGTYLSRASVAINTPITPLVAGDRGAGNVLVDPRA